MHHRIHAHIKDVFHHLYINPLEKCNLRCKMCYTRKTSPILKQEKIMGFIQRYQKVHTLQTITFCGGEVFTLPFFPDLVNEITERDIFVQIITNGIIDKLNELKKPNSINLIVSLDGLEEYHDANRGFGMFRKSIKFLKHAQKKQFHTEIFSIVTRQNVKKRAEFEAYVQKELKNIPITYHPRKPPEYLMRHPVSSRVGEIKGFDFLTKKEMTELMKTATVFPPPHLGCYQISLMSDGRVFGCCEGVTPIGAIDDDILFLTNQLKKRLEIWSKSGPSCGLSCLGCVEPTFICGIKNVYPS